MRSFKHLLRVLLFLTVVASTTAFAGGFQLYELGTPILGTAGAGQAAVADDASTSYFNPAGMTQLHDSQAMLGAQVIVGSIKFRENQNTTISGGNGGNAGLLAPGLGVYYVYSHSPKLKFGMSVTTPYAGGENYSDGWAGRFVVQDVFLFTLNFNPSMAYKVNNWLSVGGGVVAEYALYDQTIAISLPGRVDGQVEVDRIDDIAPGFNLGILITPSDKTRIGIAYRSQVKHKLGGDVRFFRLSVTPSVRTELKEPQNVIVSLYQKLTDKFAIVGDVGWSNWSVFENTIVQIGGIAGVVIPRNWKDTWRAGLGVRYHFTPAFMLQAGASYDSSPTNSSDRLPDLPMDRQIRVGTGIKYTVTKDITVAASYEYADFGDANIHNVNSTTGTLSGKYSSNHLNAVQLSINVKI